MDYIVLDTQAHTKLVDTALRWEFDLNGLLAVKDLETFPDWKLANKYKAVI